MAEILLARLPGEHGFARAVVIKRVLSHLARVSEFETMFLDEARIMSGIHHPNVVQVFDLGREADELFLVMEYLEGESAAGLMRRLALIGESLDPYQAAHIVAEVCAGLHAAHELRDAGGNPQNLVHRDVNPQNVFVGYDGSVKLLDFGVAKAADRISRTEAGQVKGKFSYMSPEQCEGKLLDRRSDVFALGIVLYELGTGHRLFARPSEMLTFRAIARDPVLPPSEVWPDFPRRLETICMKALERQRDRRYQTAAEMRRDLLDVLREAPAGEPLDECRALLMRRIFSDRVEEKSELMRRLRSGSEVTAIPSAEIDLDAELPSVVARSDTTIADGTATESSLSAPALQRRRRSIWTGAGITAAMLAIGAFVLGRRGNEAAPTPPLAVSVVESTATPAPTAREVVLSIYSEPPGASVRFKKAVRGTTPLDLTVPHGAEPVTLELSREGHVTLQETVVPDRDMKLKLTLLPSTTAKGRGEVRRPKPSPAASDAKPKSYYQF
jgi:serine/threonine-protein kinase